MADKMLDNGMKIVVGLMVFALVLAVLGPMAINAYHTPSSSTYNQTENNQVQVVSGLNSNVSSVSDSGTKTVSLTLNETATGNTKTVSSLAEGNNTTVTFSRGGDVTVSFLNKTSNTSAKIQYEYPDDFGWSSGSQALYGLVPLFIILGGVLWVVKKVK